MKLECNINKKNILAINNGWSAMLPNFFIIGAARCATGWINQCLGEHPEIFTTNYETNFFDRNFNNGLIWWQNTYFSKYNGEKAIGEKTADYLCNPKVPQRMFVTIPNAKLICSLRDPIDRMFSHFIMLSRRRGLKINKNTFLKLAKLNSDFVQRGLYFKQIKRYLKFFPRQNLLVKIYEDKFINPIGFIQDMYKFLGVKSTFIPPSVKLQIKPGTLEQSNKLLLFLSRIFARPRTPYPLKKLYSKLRPTLNLLELDKDDTKKLVPFFKTDILELENFLNRDLSCWKTKRLLK